MNYFEFYNIPVSFTPSQTDIKKTFYEFSKTYHPDFHSDASDLTKEETLQKSALNNEAYKTLKNFDLRLKYVLELKGAIQPTDKDDIPQDFLMEMMDINERIMEVQFDFEETAYNKLLEVVNAFESNLINSVLGILEKESQTSEDLETIKNFYYKKKYLRRLKENIEKIRED